VVYHLLRVIIIPNWKEKWCAPPFVFLPRSQCNYSEYDVNLLDLDKIFSCNKMCQLWMKAQRFRDHLWLHHQGNLPGWWSHRWSLKRWYFIHSWHGLLPEKILSSSVAVKASSLMLLDLVFSNFADFSINPAEYGIVQPDHYHPHFIIDYIMPIRRSKHTINIPLQDIQLVTIYFYITCLIMNGLLCIMNPLLMLLLLDLMLL
jgi:hypothetical protein